MNKTGMKNKKELQAKVDHWLVVKLIVVFLALVGSVFFLGKTSITGAAFVPGPIDACGEIDVPGTYTLSTSVTATGTCFQILASDVILDCQGATITFGTAGGTNSQGVYVSGRGVTVQNCNLEEGAAGDTQNGIRYDTGSHFGTIRNNHIATRGVRSTGIQIQGVEGTLVERNEVITTGSVNAHGVQISSTSFHNTIRNNVFRISSAGSFGINLRSGSSSSIIEGNSFFNTDLRMQAGVVDYTLLNNNVTRIVDNSGDSSLNYLAYNNSVGDIRWTDTSIAGFLDDLDASPTGVGLGLGKNMYIGSNIFAMDRATIPTTSRLNSRTVITLRGLTGNSIRVLPQYTQDSQQVLTTGSDCGPACRILCSYNDRVKFRVDNFLSYSSFAVSSVGGTFISGDVNNDARVDNSDIAQVVGVILGTTHPVGEDLDVVDVNCDGTVNIRDLFATVLAQRGR